MVNRIIATNGNLELHAIDDTVGYVINVDTNQKFAKHPIISILSKGVWTFIPTEEKGGPGSGFHGHRGRPGEVGGSTSNKYGIRFHEINAATAAIYGCRPSTKEERAQFLKAIDDIPPDVMKLWKGGEFIFAIDAQNKLSGWHQGNWVVAGYDAIGGISNHEFIHQIVSRYTDKLGAYSPKDIFNHANYQKDFYNRMDEDLTCMLDRYDKDPAVWAKNITGMDGINGTSKLITYEQAVDKVKAANDFLDWLGRHP